MVVKGGTRVCVLLVRGAMCGTYYGYLLVVKMGDGSRSKMLDTG
jgi:hypothetical protein